MEAVHALPAIHIYWADRFVLPLLAEQGFSLDLAVATELLHLQ
jgi:hypothetical protein